MKVPPLFYKKMAKKNLWVQILSSIFLAILLITFVNLGIKQFYPPPEYNDYCDPQEPREGDDTCYQDYDNAQSEYNQSVFYIYAIIGLIGIALGLSIPNLIAQISGIGSGFVLVIWGMVRNNDSTLTLFITSGLLIAIVIFMLFRFQKKWR